MFSIHPEHLAQHQHAWSCGSLGLSESLPDFQEFQKQNAETVSCEQFERTSHFSTFLHLVKEEEEEEELL